MSDTGEGRRRRKPPARISTRYLRWVIDTYLQRYATSRSHLRRLLGQRVRRSCAHHGDDVDQAMELVDAELDRLQRVGLLDDARYARDRARVLHRRGNGQRAIRAKLAAKGLRGAVVDAALDALAEDLDQDPELLACARWARKRRLGPWARQPIDADDYDTRRKVMARFGRAGFSFDLARRVLAAESVEELE